MVDRIGRVDGLDMQREASGIGEREVLQIRDQPLQQGAM